MAQYTEIGNDESIEMTDGVDTYRYVELASVLYLQKVVGESTTDVASFELAGDAGAALFRVGARDGHWVIDQCYSPITSGFLGEEGFDWDRIEGHTL